MKPISQTSALKRLQHVKDEFAREVRDRFEHAAKSCVTCETPGACCLDAHFVNVRITRLEAVAIGRVIDRVDEKEKVYERIDQSITRYGLTSEDSRTYACPLFEKGVGCLVHDIGKPLPCIAHACYENKDDLPPDELLAEREAMVSKLNELTFRQPSTLVSLPVAVARVRR